MKAWTDYPFRNLGDKPNKVAPVREIEVLSYDGDKYCQVKYAGVFEEQVKAGYIYQSEGRYGEVPCISKGELEKLPKREID
jgi:hypothetical protein